MIVTVEVLAKAFEAWETAVRLSPDQFITHEEAANKLVSELAKENAQHLFEVLNSIKVTS